MVPAPDPALTESPETLNVSVDRTRRAQMGDQRAAVDGRLRVIRDRRRRGPGAIARPNLPQRLAATFLKHIHAGFIGVFPFQNAAIPRSKPRTAQVKTWKIRRI